MFCFGLKALNRTSILPSLKSGSPQFEDMLAMFLLGLEFTFKLLFLFIGPVVGTLGGAFLLLLIVYQYWARLYARFIARRGEEHIAIS
jgi:hypothetical protein